MAAPDLPFCKYLQNIHDAMVGAADELPHPPDNRFTGYVVKVVNPPDDYNRCMYHVVSRYDLYRLNAVLYNDVHPRGPARPVMNDTLRKKKYVISSQDENPLFHRATFVRVFALVDKSEFELLVSVRPNNMHCNL